jgi:TP901-1 family phage major tail protein
METQLRAALLTWLRADPALGAAVNMVAEEAPARVTPPWLGIVASAATDWSTKDRTGREVRVAIELHVRGDDAGTAGALADALAARIAALPRAQPGFEIASTGFLRSRAEQRPRGAARIPLPPAGELSPRATTRRTDMTAQKGAAFLLKIGDGATPPAYQTVAGLRTTQMSINGDTVVVTHKESGGWRELLSGAGTRSVSVSAAGIFLGSTAEAQVRANALAGTIDNYQLSFEDGEKLEGRFLVQRLDYAGDFNGERNYTLQLESSGAVVPA